MICTLLAGEPVWLDPEEWARWVEDGHIPPDASVRFSDSQEWVRADSLERYRELLRLPDLPPAPPTSSIREVLFPRRGISATELVLLANLAVAGILLLLWGSGYLPQLRTTVMDWWRRVHDTGAYYLWIPTLFMHVGPGHLFRNLIALVAGAGASEFLMGPRRTIGLYLATGIAGAALSYFGHDRPPLSVGASGAAFGLAGAVLGFLVRRHRSFGYRQQWKARRVYLPIFVVFVGQSLLNADYLAHTGGFVSGVILGFILPPHARVAELSAAADADRVQ